MPVATQGWCSRASAAVAESTGGTAPVARAWLVVEQPGPWGRDAVRESRLPGPVAEELLRRTAALGIRLALARRPGRHPDLPGGLRHAWLARTAPPAALSWLRFCDPAELLEADLAALLRADPAGSVGDEPGGFAGGEPAGFAGGEPAGFAGGDPGGADPVLLVCTNARRDRCCAAFGRPLAEALAARHPDRVWETSHLGGHRFAATAVVLPTGYVYGRLTVPEAEAVLDAARTGTVHLPGLRGRSAWDPAGQVAEIAVRGHAGVREAGALHVAAASGGPVGDRAGTVVVAHRDGRRWEVDVVAWASEGPTRPESCGKPARPVTGHRAVAVRPVA